MAPGKPSRRRQTPPAAPLPLYGVHDELRLEILREPSLPRVEEHAQALLGNERHVRDAEEGEPMAK
eukprot:3492619-Pleurochrysis_carterae.AAC.2